MSRHNRSRSRFHRPSLTLWRHRHLVIALCLGAAAVLTLNILRPSPEEGREVLVAARTISAGGLITDDDVETRSVPPGALPADGLADRGVIGSRAAIGLEEGTVLTASMTSAALAVGLGADERLVQVPVEVGAQLAQPGARVDVVGEGAGSGPGDRTGDPGDQQKNEGNEGDEGNADSAQTPSESAVLRATSGTTVLCRNARVVQTVTEGTENRWTAGRKVTLVTLALPASDASLVVGAATNGALGVVLSP